MTKNIPQTLVNTDGYEYDGGAILRTALILDQVETGSSQLPLYINIGRVIVFLLIYALNYEQYGKYKAGDFIILISVLFLTLTIHYFNLIFVIFGLTDFKRKRFIQKIMGAFINAERNMNDSPFIKFTPVINLINPNYLKRWIILRKTALDLGEKYTRRVFMYTSCFIIIYGFLAAVFILTFFKLLQFDIVMSVAILGAYDILTILGFIIQMIRVGAEVNIEFIKHKEILMGIKRHLINIHINYEALSNKKVFNSSSLSVIIKLFKESELNKEERDGRIDELTMVIDNNIEQLDHDFEHSSLKLIGFTCTYELLNSVYSGILSLTLFSGQYLYTSGDL
jgi:hypothetical protein